MKDTSCFQYFIYLILLVVIIFYAIQYIIYYIKIYNKTLVKDSLIILWDIHCKQNFIDYITNNDIKSYNIVRISEVGFVIQRGENYVCFMTRHPQQYNNIDILLNEITTVINTYNIKNIISFSTAGSHEYNIGAVLQFTSAIIENPKKYSLDFSYIESNNVFIKTNVLVNKPITDTKGFIVPSKNQVASGQDEFVIYYVSNKMNIPCITLTGISDNDNIQEYDNGGGDDAAKNLINYFFTNFYIV
jgi:hypothetical protein